MSDRSSIPPLPGEDHRCEQCGLAYEEVGVDAALAAVRTVPAAARRLCASVDRATLRRQPETGWSMLEYLCHLRDVYAAGTIRLHRARTEERPVVEPMLNDLRARRFRYNELDPAAVLDELAANVAGFAEEAARVGAGGWSRVVRRRPDEERTARWLVRHAMHEGHHHLDDLRRLAGW